MNGLSSKKYNSLPLALKYKVVEEVGNYITRRRHLTYNIELFELHDYYVEVWRSIATNQIYWIECPDNDYVYKQYVDQIKLEELF